MSMHTERSKPNGALLPIGNDVNNVAHEVTTTSRDLRAMEIAAMQRLEGIFEGLPPESTARVLRWFAGTAGVVINDSVLPMGQESPVGRHPEPKSLNDIADLFDLANPTSGPERALLGAYWLQGIGATEDFDSQTVNSALKNLGYPSSNITSDFSKLMNRKPRLVQQVRKDGKTKQARKKYKLTREGIRAAEQMLSSAEEG